MSSVSAALPDPLVVQLPNLCPLANLLMMILGRRVLLASGLLTELLPWGVVSWIQGCGNVAPILDLRLLPYFPQSVGHEHMISGIRVPYVSQDNSVIRPIHRWWVYFPHFLFQQDVLPGSEHRSLQLQTRYGDWFDRHKPCLCHHYSDWYFACWILRV